MAFFLPWAGFFSFVPKVHGGLGKKSSLFFFRGIHINIGFSKNKKRRWACCAETQTPCKKKNKKNPTHISGLFFRSIICPLHMPFISKPTRWVSIPAVLSFFFLVSRGPLKKKPPKQFAPFPEFPGKTTNKLWGKNLIGDKLLFERALKNRRGPKNNFPLRPFFCPFFPE